MSIGLSGHLPSGEERSPELTPEEAALVFRIGIFVKMRWMAIAGVLIASLLATRVFNISFPLLPVYIICAIMAGYNLWFLYQARSISGKTAGSLTESLTMPIRQLLVIPKSTSPLIEQARAIGNIHITVDLVVLTD